jgi:Osmosensitive K+ channel histidine kinase
MKLWLKQSFLALMIILFSVSACLYFFVALETDNILRRAKESGETDLEAFCEHLASLDATHAFGHNQDELAQTAIIQYTFSVYAHIMQNANSAYSLVMEDRYLYNISSSDPKAHLPMAEDALTGAIAFFSNGKPVQVLAKRYDVFMLPVTIYLTRDISDVYRDIDSLSRSAQMALCGCLLLSGILLPLGLRKTLYPLKGLTRISKEIAGGQYALRSNLHTPDEVGALSASFDEMAQTVEVKIRSLEDTAKRRELLLGALTHEMKTPMTAIIGFSDSLLKMPLSEEERAEAAHEIHEAALRTERLSQKMMQLISLHDCPALIKKPISVSTLFEQAEKTVTSQLDAKKLMLKTNAQLRTISGDSDLLLCLITNLLDNAAKASDVGAVIALSCCGKDTEACIAVVDSGSGIEKSQIPLVTEPFYRVDKARSRVLGGAGLGLALCEVIVKAHGGRLKIQSEAGRGTTVYAYLKKEGEHE